MVFGSGAIDTSAGGKGRMVGRRLQLLICTIIFLAAIPPAFGGVIINEVMSNEPGGDVTLEWIELFNNSDINIFLGFYNLEIGGNSMALPGVGIEPMQYIVLCRKLLIEGTTPGFESRWGDSNGVWGDDSTLEYYPALEISDIRLDNDSGTIKLNFAGTTLSTFRWSKSGKDGISWERQNPADSVILNSVDAAGSTPGTLNSITPQQYDLALLQVDAWPDTAGLAGFSIMFANVGEQAFSSDYITLAYDPNFDGIADSSDIIAVLGFPSMMPDDTLRIVTSIELQGYYPYVLVSLPPDDRPRNDKRLIQAFGKEYPPVVLSEFIADPQENLDQEWVELKNRSPFDVDLKDWYLGDSINLYPIVDTEYILSAGGYVVLCRDSAALINYYSPQEFLIIQMSSWAILNDRGDLIRLRDNLGYIADSLRYGFVYGGNFSWGRGEESGMTDRWGRAKESGGTPGRANEIYYQPSAKEINLKAVPNPFSYSRDGTMTIEFSVPPGDDLIMRIYDLEGRIVRTLIDDLPAFDGQISWDGRTDAGRMLSVGMYILFIEIPGADQYKQTIVIAP